MVTEQTPVPISEGSEICEGCQKPQRNVGQWDDDGRRLCGVCKGSIWLEGGGAAKLARRAREVERLEGKPPGILTLDPASGARRRHQQAAAKIGYLSHLWSGLAAGCLALERLVELECGPQPTSDFDLGDTEAEALERDWHEKRDAITDNVFSGVIWAQREGVEDAIASQIRVIENCDFTGHGLADPRGQVRRALVQNLSVEFVDRAWPLD